MSEDFIDYYEILQVNPKADTTTIERIYRYLAKEYHPDNIDTGDREQFESVLKAYQVLNDPESRAEFDIKHRNQQQLRWKLVSEAVDEEGFYNDHELQHRILSLLYVQRRREIGNPTLGSMHLSQLIDCPVHHIDFHLWYLKEKGWIRRTENGMFAITAEGVDKELESRVSVRRTRLLTADKHEPEAEG